MAPKIYPLQNRLINQKKHDLFLKIHGMKHEQIQPLDTSFN